MIPLKRYNTNSSTKNIEKETRKQNIVQMNQSTQAKYNKHMAQNVSGRIFDTLLGDSLNDV